MGSKMSFAKHDTKTRQAQKPSVKGKSQIENGGTRCALCIGLDDAKLTSVKEALLSPENPCTIRAAAKKWGFTEREVARHLHQCLSTTSESRYTRVARAFDLLWQAIDVAHVTYMSKPDMYNGTAYQALLKQLRALMVDLENVQNSDELVADITQYALNPLITQITQSVISEAGSLKEDLTAKFDDSEAERLVGDFVRRLASHFKRASEIAHERITDTLGARDKNRVKASGGPGRPKKPQGKHANLRAVG
jgi:hypothetical protein